MNKKVQLPKKKKELEDMSVEELMDVYGAFTFTIATLLRNKTEECGGCIGMNLLGVFLDANQQAEQMYCEEHQDKEGNN